jgi:methylmalonyl-CoA mutase C-terminal domain/subunit
MSASRPPITVLLAKPGLDGHDHGAKVVVRALIEAGMRVRYTGPAADAGDVVHLAQEQRAGRHRALQRWPARMCPCVNDSEPLLERAGLGDKLWIIGGNLPQRRTMRACASWASAACSRPSSRLDDIVKFIEANVA